MIEMYIRRLAGVMILAGLVLGYFVNNIWLLIPAFVGLNLLQSSFTKWCPAEKIIKKILEN
jgi:hypothetical protein